MQHTKSVRTFYCFIKLSLSKCIYTQIFTSRHIELIYNTIQYNNNIKSNIKLFADDTSLYVIIDGDPVNATKQLNDDLTQISAWADNWLVKFNTSKSKALTISLKKNKDTIELPLTFNNSVLDTVTKHKHLGIEINSNLTWKDHCKTIYENASKKLNILATLKTLNDRKTLTTMYTSFVRPGLEYGSIIFCNCLRD